MATTQVKRRRPADIPVASGWFLIAALLLGAMIVIPFSPIGNWIHKEEPDTTDLRNWEVGKTGRGRITLVTADYSQLGCNNPKAVDGAHCAFKSDTEAWPKDPSAPLDDNGANLIQPYRTIDNKLVLIAGLWAEPNMAMRLHREPPAGVQTNKLARFIADCELRFVDKWDQVKVRWSPGQQWVGEGNAPVARAVSCKILEE
jgi:hypothetical protein